MPKRQFFGVANSVLLNLLKDVRKVLLENEVQAEIRSRMEGEVCQQKGRSWGVYRGREMASVAEVQWTVQEMGLQHREEPHRL